MKNPVAGEIWSLLPAESRIDVPTPLVVWHIDSNGVPGGLPMFMEYNLSTDQDLLLSENPYWLNGERWCATKDFLAFDADRLRMRLEKLDPLIYGQVRRFIQTGDTTLTRGIPVIPEFLDPRPKWRSEWLDFVAECVEKNPVKDLVIKTISFWREISGRIKASFEGQPLDSNELAAIPVREAGSDAPGLQYEIQVDHYTVIVVPRFDRSLWRLAFKVDANEIILLEVGGEVSLKPHGGFWVLSALRSLKSGSYKFRIIGKSGESEFSVNLGGRGR